MVSDLAQRRRLRTWRLKVTALPAAVSLVRAHVTAKLHEWGYTNSDYHADAELVVSELVTNAILALDSLDETSRQRNPLHFRHLVRVELRETSGGVRIEVWDSVPCVPVFGSMPPAETVNGRGLSIVREIAAETGVRPVRDPAVGGKVVYAALAHPGGTREGRFGGPGVGPAG